MAEWQNASLSEGMFVGLFKLFYGVGKILYKGLWAWLKTSLLHSMVSFWTGNISMPYLYPPLRPYTTSRIPYIPPPFGSYLTPTVCSASAGLWTSLLCQFKFIFNCWKLYNVFEPGRAEWTWSAWSCGPPPAGDRLYGLGPRPSRSPTMKRCYWKCNFPITPPISRTVGHDFLKRGGSSTSKHL